MDGSTTQKLVKERSCDPPEAQLDCETHASPAKVKCNVGYPAVPRPLESRLTNTS